MTVHCPENRPAFESLDNFVDHLIAQAQPQLPELDLARWKEDLQARLTRIQDHPEQGLGFLEETIRQATLELQRALLQQALQAKADTVEEHCPDCQRPLRDQKRRVARSIDAYCGKVQLRRTHGWCARCQRWHFPADRVLGLQEDSHASPLVQELSALLVSKMPAEQAEALSVRMLGRSLSRSTLARQAHRQGQHALALRQQLIQAPVVPSAAPPEEAPFTLVIQLDAWHIRERDHWGQTQALRRRNEEPQRWHWVYTGTCFRLHQRGSKGRSRNKLRAFISERSYVATRGGLESFMQQLQYEARVRGLTRAQRVLVIADGAVWIWKLAADRFPEAVQRLDLYHANTYLWAVANEQYGAGTPAARRWVKPLLRQIRQDQVVQVIEHLQELQPQLERAAAHAAAAAIEYYGNNQQRMKYQEARRRNEPVGSGAIESTCRQLQCRLKRCGQFWSTAGDEALMALDMFWRNDRWELLFPHAKLTALTNN
jgi:hypothetical protein